MNSRTRKGGKHGGPFAWQKLAFAEDLEADPTLSGVQKGLIGTIAKNYNNRTGQSECSLTFLAAAVGTTKKVVARYAHIIVASKRVSIVKPGAGRASTKWSVNWWFRGSGYVRLKNDGKPIFDCRDLSSESPKASPLESPKMSPSGGDVPGDSKPRRVPRVGDQTLSSSKEERKVACDQGAWAFRPAPGAATCSRMVMVSESDVKKTANGETVAHFSISNAIDGEPYGELDIVLESNTVDRQDEGQRKLTELSRVTAGDVVDTADMHGIPFLMTPAGGILPDHANDNAMEMQNLFDLANTLDRLEGHRKFWRPKGPDRDLIVAELKRLAGNHMKEAA
ncbi:hypothetical protein NKI88_09125 [Mesorhizobium sp. M0317]|uniref:hypothetical protein n=1 Tax=Mesorhizobium sp. M0317 TaxID=2956935 RepID=UPI00333BB69D